MIVKSAELGQVAAMPSQFPLDGFPEVIFAGRSNVGKSSLINALLGRKRLAQTSSTPGKTKLIFFYRINASLYFVDLPGYGYAQVSQEVRATFKVLVDSFFQRSAPSSLCLLLLDPKRRVGGEELDFLKFLHMKGYSPLVIFTRWDRLKASERTLVKRERVQELGSLAPNPLFLSAKTREGVDELWKVIDTHLSQLPQ